VRRREFIAGLGGAVGWPLVARAQQSAMPVIGFLSGQSADTSAFLVDAFRQGLKETGYVEGRNLTIEFRWAENQINRLTALAADLVSRHVAVIAATGGGGTAASLAAKAATTTVPIVFTSGVDPVKVGLVASLNRPGGNVTGVTFLALVLDAKRLELLHEMVPNVSGLGVLLNPNFSDAEEQLRNLQDAARAARLQIHVSNASNIQEIDSAFDAFKQIRVGALLVGTDPFFISRREQIVALAARFQIPTMYGEGDFCGSGGLMSYGASFPDAVRQVGIYTGKILNGEKPANLPVLQPTKFKFVINIKAANALGLTVSPSLLARADEVIE
jgi:putative tryptophan/tyrosine transport system substrate-binding protein